MRKTLIMGVVMLCTTLQTNAQGNNSGMGGDEGDVESLATKVMKQEKKNDMFNVYLNYAASVQVNEQDNAWNSAFANKQLRLEIMGHITDKLYYRLRHRLNSSNQAARGDNFARATDLMLIGYDFNKKIGVQAGKVCQAWGGYEYDENPMYIYEYSEFVNRMDIFKAGASVSYKPVETQEFVFQVTNTYSGNLQEEYGEKALALGKKSKVIKSAGAPFTYILNWNGSFFGNRLQTRWAVGLQKLAVGQTAKLITLGQKLNLPKLQVYLDYMSEWDDVDHLRLVSEELVPTFDGLNRDFDHFYFQDTRYHSFIAKANWQFYPQWNLMLKGAYETAHLDEYNAFQDYRKSYSYLASVEYYPIKKQDLRFFLAYVGRHVNYEYDDWDYSTNRIELGLMYRIKCY